MLWRSYQKYLDEILLMGTPCFSAIYRKGDNFSDFQFPVASVGDVALPKWDLLLKKRIWSLLFF